MIMMGVYTILIAGSAFVAAWMGLRVLHRIGRETNFPPTAPQLALVVSAIAFLTVVSVPAGVLIAALVLIATGIFARTDRTLASKPLGLGLLAAVLLATVGVWESPGSWPAQLPLAVALLVGALLLGGMLETARRAQPTLLGLGGVVALSTVPLMVAPLVFSDTHSSLALDGAILLAALLPGMIWFDEDTPAPLLLRLPVALLMTYGAIQALHYGAWPMGVTALLIFGGGITFAPRSAA